MLAAALEARNRPRDQIRERIEDTGRHLVHRMERFLNALGTIASAGPLLGLLGTVIGMIQMFLGILDHGVGDVNQLAGGIGKALVCTATGMIVAIPALMFHRYFRAASTATWWKWSRKPVPCWTRSTVARGDEPGRAGATGQRRCGEGLIDAYRQ